MRIVVYLYGLGGGGAERVSALLTRHWLQAGHDVTMLTLDSAKGDYYPLERGIQRQALGLAAGSSGPLAAMLNNVRRVLALREALRKLRPDVTLAMMQTANVHLALVGPGVGGVRVGSERTYPPATTSGRLWALLRRLSYRRLDAVVALTAKGNEWLRQNVPCQRLTVIANPVVWPPDRIEPCIPVGAHQRADRHMVLSVGRLAKEKQFDHLIDVFARLAGTHADWDLVILGDGPERERLARQVVALGLQHRVALPGRAGNPGDWYGAAHLFVMCSAYEGLPNALIEALAAGLPAISYDCDTGPRDVIRDGLDGVLVAANDRVALQTAMTRLMSDRAQRESMSRHAVHARERFSLTRIGQQWDDLFRQLLTTRR